jgi:uncharacterized protein (TIGR02217 family)
MTFHNVRLPDDIERGAEGGPEFNVTIASGFSGFEKRNANWEQARGSWDISYGVQNKDGYTRLLDFWYARGGPLHSFPFKDWSDFEIPRQIIGTTDGVTATFQIFLRYISGAFTFDRTITKPVSGTVRVWVNDVEISEGAAADQFQVDLLTGIVTLGATLLAQTGTNIEVECEFNVPVRFDRQKLDIRLLWEQAGNIPSIMLIEVRGE